MVLALEKEPRVTAEALMFGQFVADIGRWLTHNTGEMLIAVALGGISGFLIRFFLPHLAPGGGLGSILGHPLVLGGLSSLGFGLIGYWRGVGAERFFRGLANAPRAIALLFAWDGRAVRTHVFWGMAVSLVAAQVVSPYLGAAVGVGVLAIVPSALGRMLASLIARAFASLVGKVAPTRDQALRGELAVIIGIIGSCAGLLAGGLIANGAIKLALAGICAGLAFTFAAGAKTRTPPAASLILVFLSLALFIDGLHPVHALAQAEGAGDQSGGTSDESYAARHGFTGPHANDPNYIPPTPGEMTNPLVGGAPPAAAPSGAAGPGAPLASSVTAAVLTGAAAPAGLAGGEVLAQVGQGRGWPTDGPPPNPVAAAGSSSSPANAGTGPPSTGPEQIEARPAGGALGPPPNPFDSSAKAPDGAAPTGGVVPTAPDQPGDLPPLADAPHTITAAPTGGVVPAGSDQPGDLPPLADVPHTLDTITAAPTGGVVTTAPDQPGDLPPLAYAPHTLDAITAGPSDDAGPAEGEPLIGDDGRPVRIGRMGVSDLRDQSGTDEAGESPGQGQPPDGQPPDPAGQAKRIKDLINRLRDKLPGNDGAIADRILGKMDLANPSADDIAKLQRLVQALINRAQGAAEFGPAAALASDLNNCVRGLSIVAGIGQGAASVVWGGTTAGAIYGAAGAMDFNRSPIAFTLNALGGAALGGALGWAFGKVGDKLPKLMASYAPSLANFMNGFEIPGGKAVGAGLAGAGISMATARLFGDSPQDVVTAGLSGGAGGMVGSYMAQEAARATELARLRAIFKPTPGPPTNEPVLFGQVAVSPNFSNAGGFKGASIQDVAARLAVGGDAMGGVVQRGDTVRIPGEAPYTALDPEDLPVQYMWANGKRFVINNRSQTTLSLVGKQPTRLIDKTGELPRWGPDSEVSVLTRLTEMGNAPSDTSNVRLRDSRNSPIAYQVKLQQNPPGASSAPPRAGSQ